MILKSSYQHQILGSLRKLIAPEESRSGLLGDVMGLGKSLTMLSAVVMSLEDARLYAKQQSILKDDICIGNVRRLKATLVIVPSARKLKSLC